MKLTKIDKMFLELKGVKIIASDDKETWVECRSFCLMIKDNKITAWRSQMYMIDFGESNVEEVINTIKTHEKIFYDAKTELQKLLNTPLEEKKKFIYEHLEEL